MSSRAGQPAEASDLIDIDELIAAYYDRKPDAAVPEQRVAFGTSGHRGSSLNTSFNEDHILATTQAIVDYRTAQGITGPLFLGRDTHSSLARRTQRDRGPRGQRCRRARRLPRRLGPDPRAEPRDPHLQPRPRRLRPRSFRRHRRDPLAQPLRATAVQVQPPHGGPADTDATGWIADRANELIAAGLEGVARTPHADIDLEHLGQYDFRDANVRDLASIIDVDAIKNAGVRIGRRPAGWASWSTGRSSPRSTTSTSPS